MIELLRAWFRRYFSDPEVASLILMLVVGAGVVVFAGHLLAPFIAALVIAFVLEGPVGWLCRRGLPRLLATTIVFVLFLATVALFFVGMVPLLADQLRQLLRELPQVFGQIQAALRTLPARYPHFISDKQIGTLINDLQKFLEPGGQQLLSLSLASVLGLLELVVYLIIVPLLVFFFLKDKDRLLVWVESLLPRQRALAVEVWREVDRKFFGYVRGKILEVILFGVTNFVSFAFFHLHFALLLAVLVGVSVIIPYVGASVATVVVLFMAYVQWGFTDTLAYVVGVYTVIQFIDGNLLVPLLFSEMVSLHPVAIMAAVLLFGGLWGLWGVFFAIPLATLIQAVLHAIRRVTARREIVGQAPSGGNGRNASQQAKSRAPRRP